MEKSFSIIAETAFTHEGDLNYLFELINEAVKGKADFIKFQIMTERNHFACSHPKFRDSSWLFSEKQWRQAFEHALSLGLKIIGLPVNEASLDFIGKSQKYFSFIEVHPINFNNLFFLEKFKTITIKNILGIGGQTLDDICFANKYINKDSIYMFGFQTFPTSIYSVNLGKIYSIKKLFPDGYVGYADHSTYENDSFLDMCSYAYISGATFFEKHITLSKGEKRIDYESAISSEDFLKLHEQMSKVEAILGTDNLNRLNDREIQYKNRELQLVAKNKIAMGEQFTFDNLTYKITEDKSDFGQKEITKIVGRHARTNIFIDECIKFNHLK